MKHSIPEKMVSALVEWYDGHSREMPWRGSRDPYHIWVSEMMLQQTQVATVRKYYPLWIERFPDVFSLAEASLEEVLKTWEGLGYYTRARNFHKGAKYIAEHADSREAPFPGNYGEWLKVPGVGPYTAAAVSSIAFAYPAGVVDANVLRVMSRLFCEDVQTGNIPLMRELSRRIGGAFYGYHPGQVNQAWMELGSLQCRPEPLCGSCPLEVMCCARQHGQTHRYPVKKAKRTIPLRRGAAFVIRRGEKTLMVRRRAEGFLGGLWEYPGFTLKKAETDTQYFDAFVRDNHLRVGKKIGAPVRHTYSHFHQHMDIYSADIRKTWDNAYWEQSRWVSAGELSELPRSGLAIKIGKHYRQQVR